MLLLLQYLLGRHVDRWEDPRMKYSHAESFKFNTESSLLVLPPHRSHAFVSVFNFIKRRYLLHFFRNGSERPSCKADNNDSGNLELNLMKVTLLPTTLRRPFSDIFLNSITKANDFCLFLMPETLAWFLRLISIITKLDITIFNNINERSVKRFYHMCCSNNIVWKPRFQALFNYRPNYTVEAPFTLHLGDLLGSYATSLADSSSPWC